MLPYIMIKHNYNGLDFNEPSKGKILLKLLNILLKGISTPTHQSHQAGTVFQGTFHTMKKPLQLQKNIGMNYRI